MIRSERVTVTSAGVNGSAVGSQQTHPFNGRLVAAHLDYAGEPGTTDVTIATSTAPVRSLLVVTNNSTDGWYFPRAQVQDTAAAALTWDGTHGIYEAQPVDDSITVSIAQGDDAGTVVATLYVES